MPHHARFPRSFIRLAIPFTAALGLALLAPASQARPARHAQANGAGADDSGPEHRRGRRGKRSPEERAAHRAKRRAKVQAKLKTYLTVELATELELNESQTAKLGTAVAAHIDARHARGEAVRGEMKKLRGMLKEGADDTTLAAQTQAVIAARAAAKADDGGLVRATAGFLSTRQQAQMVALLPKLERQVRQMARGKHGKKGRRGGRGRRGKHRGQR